MTEDCIDRYKKTQPFSRKMLKTVVFFRYACYRADVLTTGMGWIRRMGLIMMCYRYSYLRAYERNPPDPILKGGKNPVALGRKGEEDESYGSIGSPTEMRT